MSKILNIIQDVISVLLAIDRAVLRQASRITRASIPPPADISICSYMRRLGDVSKYLQSGEAANIILRASARNGDVKTCHAAYVAGATDIDGMAYNATLYGHKEVYDYACALIIPDATKQTAALMRTDRKIPHALQYEKIDEVRLYYEAMEHGFTNRIWYQPAGIDMSLAVAHVSRGCGAHDMTLYDDIDLDIALVLKYAAEGNHEWLCRAIRARCDPKTLDCTPMLCGAARAGNEELCNLAREWAAESSIPLDYTEMALSAIEGHADYICILAHEWACAQTYTYYALEYSAVMDCAARHGNERMCERIYAWACAEGYEELCYSSMICNAARGGYAQFCARIYEWACEDALESTIDAPNMLISAVESGNRETCIFARDLMLRMCGCIEREMYMGLLQRAIRVGSLVICHMIAYEWAHELLTDKKVPRGEFNQLVVAAIQTRRKDLCWFAHDLACEARAELSYNDIIELVLETRSYGLCRLVCELARDVGQDFEEYICARTRAARWLNEHTMQLEDDGDEGDAMVQDDVAIPSH